MNYVLLLRCFSYVHTDYTGAVSNVDEIILSPPSSLTVTEGDMVLVPCVGSVDPVFSGSLPAAIGGSVSLSGLMFIADLQDNGILSCQVGAETIVATIEVFGKYDDDFIIHKCQSG